MDTYTLIDICIRMVVEYYNRYVDTINKITDNDVIVKSVNMTDDCQEITLITTKKEELYYVVKYNEKTGNLSSYIFGDKSTLEVGQEALKTHTR